MATHSEMAGEVLQSVAFVFPGQGSQSVGMLDAFSESNAGTTLASLVQDTLDEASQALGYDLGALIHADPEERLAKTEVTQPAILVTSVATWRAWKSLGGASPSVMAGHSLGEYSALVCAGALSLADGASLVRDRGALMQQAVPEGEGAMAAILGLTDEQIRECCDSVEGAVAPANYNAPGQVVIAGQAAAVASAIEACKAAGAKRALPVAMSVPSHSTLMSGAAQALGERLAGVELVMPEIPVVHNVDATIASSTEEIEAKLTAQLHNPVRWTECAEVLKQRSITQIAECGPGKVLSGLQKRIDKSLSAVALGTPEQLQDFLVSNS